MTLTKGGETRRLSHYHCHGWMAYATPAPNIVLQLRRRLIEDYRKTLNKESSAKVEEEAPGDKEEATSSEAEKDKKEEEEGESISSSSSERGPPRWPCPIVHCSDGGNRSGMFAAVLDSLAMCEEIGEVDVFATAKRLISDRRSLLTDPEHLR